MAEREGISVFRMEMEAGLPDHHCIRIQGVHGIYEGHALFLEEENLFVFYIIWGLIAPEDKCEELAWMFLQKNYELKIGQWLIDPDSRVITLRTTQYLDKGEATAIRIRKIIEDCGRLADEFYPEISSKVF